VVFIGEEFSKRRVNAYIPKNISMAIDYVCTDTRTGRYTQ
jgi:hypothetical protein